MNEPPVLPDVSAPTPIDRGRRLWLVLVLMFAVIACVSIVAAVLALLGARRVQAERVAMARQLAVTRSELESARRDLAKAIAAQSATANEVGRTFAGLRQLLDYYEAQGFRLLSRFERSQWPAKVVHQKDATNEISVVLKKGGRHRFPGHTGYQLRMVVLEDDSGDETVVILKSNERVVP